MHHTGTHDNKRSVTLSTLEQSSKACKLLAECGETANAAG